ncbi:ATP-binding protein [Sphaerisporangium sp. TRM90804]|uniref:YifB family Mg chelatase-like AAA ATPase n=1 Tax=Sphaerisporangium sp. TRM90804 TaxID=3031113 RepID=UPI00244CD7DA|nr:ATP-binding protein [Sphaerisporangium sp. TRM90804]MDH2426463.1 ATP-binding protein [Sphaerisporangium sp. TRM90804]
MSSVVLAGTAGHLLRVEAEVGPGPSGLHLLGMPEASEAPLRDRVRAAILNSRLPWPEERVVVKLFPAHIPKPGAGRDLAVALVILAAGGVVPPEDLASAVVLGELGLDGAIRPVSDVMTLTLAAARAGMRTLIVPAENAEEAQRVSGVVVIPASRLDELVERLNGGCLGKRPPAGGHSTATPPPLDLADVTGNHAARHALEVCAAGGHHLFLLKSPQGAAAMLVEGLPGILPPLDAEAAREVAEIRSLAGTPSGGSGRPPLSAPHHTITPAAMFGGGSDTTRPGAVSLAHQGVLFLDDAPEFPGRILHGLRLPLGKGMVMLAGSDHVVRMPARFMLAMAAHPCPCRPEQCMCSERVKRAYLSRLAVLLDLVEVRAHVHGATPQEGPGESTATVAARVQAARERAAARLAGTPWRTNAEVPAFELHVRFKAERGALAPLWAALDSGLLIPTVFARLLRVAWTLADLRGADRPARQDAEGALALWAPTPHRTP